MRIFFVGQGRTRVCGETYFLYVAAGNPRRTQPGGKKTIYGWKLVRLRMNDDIKKYPQCFGKLDAVFPKGESGLRETPEKCTPCIFKVECLRSAMEGTEGLLVQEEVVDRAYSSGMISFWERWSKKKNFYRRIKARVKKN